MKKYLLIFCAFAGLLGAVSCVQKENGEVTLVKLGAAVKEFVAEADGGVINIPVYSNGAYHIEMLSKDNDWLIMTMPGDLSNNGYIKAECDFNESFKRKAVFVLCSDVDSRRDTVTFKQKGMKEAIITMSELSVQARGAGGDSTYVIQTNVPFADLQQSISYDAEEGSEEWITDINVADATTTRRTMTISTLKNNDENNPRTATVRFRFTDGWGESVTLAFNVIQRTAREKIGTTVSMRELKYEYVQSGKPIDKYIIVEGIVVSNNKGRNAGEDEQLTTSTIDYTGDQRTIYLESLDGTQGICLMTATVDDNMTNQYDHLQVLLYNTKPVLHSDPEYLTISGIKSSMIVGQTRGQASDVPSKVKAMRDLTDDDIFISHFADQIDKALCELFAVRNNKYTCRHHIPPIHSILYLNLIVINYSARPADFKGVKRVSTMLSAFSKDFFSFLFSEHADVEEINLDEKIEPHHKAAADADGQDVAA